MDFEDSGSCETTATEEVFRKCFLWFTTPQVVCRALGLAVYLIVGCQAGYTSQVNSIAISSKIGNLHAFARLYGILRWFHPSDAASVVDWEQFAVQGIRNVMNASDDQTLRRTLNDMIAPIAPTVQIIRAGEHFTDAPPSQPVVGSGAEFVSWEHEGFGDSSLPGTFVSKRRHREQAVPAPGVPYAILSQSIDAVPLRGIHLRLRARIRTANHGLGRIWMRVDCEKERGFFDNMNDRPIASPVWTTAEILGTVDKDATRIVLGTVMSLGGIVWYDDIELAAQAPSGEWKSINIKDADFESEDLWATWSPGAGRTTGSLEGWDVALDHANFAGGKTALRVSAATKTITNELFSDAPNDAEVFDIDLAHGLRARIPISLYSVNQRTWGDNPAIARRTTSWPPGNQQAGFNANWGIADVLIVWNAFQHFWPYWDAVQIDWFAQLDRGLSDALSDHNIDDHALTLKRLIASASDAHAEVHCPGETQQVRPPLIVDVIDNQVVVVAAADAALKPGDVIISVDNHSALAGIALEEKLWSGSPQWRRARAKERFGMGPMGTSLTLSVRRGLATFQVVTTRNQQVVHPLTLRAIERLEDGIYYIDLRRAALDEILSIIEPLSRAPGVVFDLRGYPNNNHNILAYLLAASVDINQGMSIPHIIRPDHTSFSSPSWGTTSTMLNPHEPHISGRTAFLTDATAYSYAETMMRLVEHYRLGAIIGAATAGTNGNMAEILTPTGCRVTFTGLRVTKVDGSRNHLIGIQPTIPAARTVAGMAGGHDEVLEKALAYVRGTLQ